MKERIQHTIDRIKNIAAAGNSVSAAKVAGHQQRPDNALSRSIRNEKEAIQFNAELKAAVALGKTR